MKLSVIKSLQKQVDLIAVAAISKYNLMIAEYKEDDGLYKVTYATVCSNETSAVVDTYLFATTCETAQDAINYVKSKVSGELIFVKSSLV